MSSTSSWHELPDIGGDPMVSSAQPSVGVSNDDEVATDNLNNIQIEYHPSAAILSQKILFTKFAQGHRPRVYKPDLSTDPWYPFQSHFDFEFAELVLEAALNKEQVNHFLKLLKSVCSTTEAFTINEYNDIQNTWKAASHHMTAFKEVVCVDGVDGKPHGFVMYYCSLWDWAHNLLKHPNIRPHFVFDVQHLLKFDGSSFIHFIDEPWTADELWNIQSKLPPDGKVLLFILYADKAKLPSFGQQKGYPVVAHLANLPVSIRNGEGIGGGHVVKEVKEYSGKPQFANFKNAVWHESFRKLLQTVEKESETGCWVNFWDGVARCFFPVILILSADYEEQAVMALICGVKSNFPCPISLIPHDHISEFPAQCKLRTSKHILKALREACSQDTLEKREQILIQQGLRDVDSAFMVIANTDIYHALSWDRLHANFTGKFGDHLWAELLRILDKAGHQAMARVEKNFSEMPRWHMLNHFEEALSISYTDGQKLEDLSKNMEKEGYLLLRCLRAYIEFDLYTALELQWSKNWNFPKNHTCMHVFDDIEAKGITHNFNTKPNEKMHGPLKEKYQKHTNFKNVMQQILDVDHLKAVSELICCRISDYEAYMETNMQSPAGSNTNDAEHEDFFHVRLGSQIKQPLTLEAIEQRGTIDKAFMRFCMKLNKLLNRYFEVTQKPLPGGKRIQLQVNHEITEYQYIKVNFKSTVDWCQYTDHLQCNPHFHGHSRYDCCIVGNESFPLALVHPYDAPTGPRLMKDVHLNLWRVREQPWESAEIFSVKSIIHSALLYLDHTRPGKHLVVDTIDTDIFLCMQMMHKAAGHH
ncbi:hypothetical protein F5141DRAFT_1188410 [Pisolithus sp. B1]|nr:hypothetical protein F5141DRAFT_1188410 [Pisolithus sp. B1]